VNRPLEYRLLVIEEPADQRSTNSGGDGGHVVACDHTSVIQAVRGSNGTSVDRPRIVGVIGATVTLFVWGRTISRVSTSAVIPRARR
jgi:hypothetical protein